MQINYKTNYKSHSVQLQSLPNTLAHFNNLAQV